MAEPWEEPDPDAVEYGMAMPFLDQSPAFALGFEAGREYGRMVELSDDELRSRSYSQTVHTENQRQLLMAAKVLGWTLRFEPLDDTFSVMHASRVV